MEQVDKHTAECAFDGTPVMKVVIMAMAFVPLFVLLMLFGLHVDIGTVGGLLSYIGCVAVMAAALVIKILLGKGRITADEERVNVGCGFLSRKIPLGDITRVQCDVETQSGRYGITYTMVLTIETAEKKYCYERELDVEDDLLAKQPEEYRKYLDSHPMRQVYEYISKRV